MNKDTPSRQVARNIEEVVRLEEEAARRRPPSSRVADLVAGFAGKLRFGLLHAALIAAWAAVNVELVPGVPAFDPYLSGCETSLAASAMRRALVMSSGPARPCGLALASRRRALRRSAATWSGVLPSSTRWRRAL